MDVLMQADSENKLRNQKLYLILGKPGATEGNEHAHQESKNDFRKMCSHSSKRYCDMLQSMNLHYLRRRVIEKYSKFAPKTRESEANLGMDMKLKKQRRKRKRHDDAIPIADAHLEASKATPRTQQQGPRAQQCCPH